MKPCSPPPIPVGLALAGAVRPALPAPVFAEDCSLLVRPPKRTRKARDRIYVLS